MLFRSGQFRQSADGRFQLIYQGDGNLVLYQGWSAPLWWTSTNSNNPGFAVMQGDGNFVVYDSTGPVWWSGTGTPGAFLVVQNDGNTVIYSAFGSPTVGHQHLLPLVAFRGNENSRWQVSMSMNSHWE